MRPPIDPKARGRRTDDIHGQHARLIAYLKANGRTSCTVLMRVCDVPSVTSRICELIALGWPIARQRGRERSHCGRWRRATFYALSGPHPQGDLFGAGA